KPTSTPAGGHPLLNAGRILVYPNGHECHKCHNIGYKNLDPGHPCRKCWQKYGKPYSGPYLQTDWKNPPPNYQRPLPKFTSSSQTSSQAPLQSQSQWMPNPALQARNSQYAPQSFGPHPNRPTTTFMSGGQPPPGALVVGPGDPRIGGTLCSACDGEGYLRGFLFFDNETCWRCNGVGRVF
ncbi:uncharacterized protein EI90DRAFT_3220548, partial [Cantharellus anzutake]|uniref:uncharacterized protein n=1 Tax=Cantharellus anzutake TaxID=1750568 RepID=UPI001904AEB4